MIPSARRRFNEGFTDARHQSLLDGLAARVGGVIPFRVSETPCFFEADLLDRLSEAARAMIRQLLTDATYRRAADAMVPDRFRVSNGERLPGCVQVDFGLVRQEDGSVEGRLVELQAFPSLYGFQMALAEASAEAWSTSSPETHLRAQFLSGLEREAYIALMRTVLVGPHDPREVVLMEIQPDQQKTRPDFVVTEATWGLRAVDTADVIKQGRGLFYRRDGVLTPIRRIYNRVIPDELDRSGVTMPFDYRDELDVEWVGGPDWFFRISKFSLPWLSHPWVPETRFLSDVRQWPTDRQDWLLKPLFSFAGGGIVFAPDDTQLDAIPEKERHLYVLQRRVGFTPVIETPHGPTQAELRIMMVREDNDYRAVLPLVRMGRGRMMGVDHNKGLAWVGASAALST
jgi:hypothetical protein